MSAGLRRRPGAVPTLTAGRALGALLSALWLVVAARLLGVVQFADLALVLAIGAVVAVIADAGYTTVVTDEVARRRALPDGLLQRVVRRRLVAALAAWAVLIVAYQLVAAQPDLAVPFLFGGSVLATAVYTTATAALRGLATPVPEAWNEVLSRTVVLGAGWTWLAAGGGVRAAVTVYALTDVASAVVLHGVALRRVDTGAAPVPAEVLSVRAVAPLSTAGVLGALYNRVDLWLLALLSTPRQVALYAASYRIFEGLLLPAGAQSALMLPRVAAADHSERSAAIVRIWAVTVLVTAALAAVVAAFAEPLLRLTFGPSYAAAAPTLRVLMLSSISGATVLVMAPIVAARRRSVFAWAVLASLVVNIAGNVIGIPSHGMIVAAVMTAVSQTALGGILVAVGLSSPVVAGKEWQT